MKHVNIIKVYRTISYLNNNDYTNKNVRGGHKPHPPLVQWSQPPPPQAQHEHTIDRQIDALPSDGHRSRQRESPMAMGTRSLPAIIDLAAHRVT